MKHERIYAAIGAADDVLLTRCENTQTHANSTPWRRIGALAACLCLLIVGVATWHNRPVRAKSARTSYDIGADACYAVPQCGTWYTTMDVSAALEAYAGQEVTYLLALTLFDSTETQLASDSQELQTELARLTDLGYNVGTLETWSYEGAGERVYYDVAVGYLTAEQIENFPASPSYGYVLSFLKNGDGIPVDAQQDYITAFRLEDGVSIQ